MGTGVFLKKNIDKIKSHLDFIRLQLGEGCLCDEGHLYSLFFVFFVLVSSDTKPLESLLLRRFGIK